MKVKTALFVLIFLMVFLIPSTVFAANTEKKCSEYDSKYTLFGYSANVDGKEVDEAVEGNISIVAYFGEKFSGSTVKDFTLWFVDAGGKQYGSEASVAKRRSGMTAILCSGDLTVVEGVTQTPPITEQDPETIASIISTYSCSNLQSTDLYIKVLNPAYKFIRIAVPSLLILLCSYDFIAATIADNADKMKKAQQRAVKRIVVGIVIFLLPSLLNALLGLFGDFSTCGVGM